MPESAASSCNYRFDNQTLLCDFCYVSFIGEESVAAGACSVLTENPTWIIDPIDGTTNFVHRYCLAGLICKPLRNSTHVTFLIFITPSLFFIF